MRFNVMSHSVHAPNKKKTGTCNADYPTGSSLLSCCGRAVRAALRWEGEVHRPRQYVTTPHSHRKKQIFQPVHKTKSHILLRADTHESYIVYRGRGRRISTPDLSSSPQYFSKSPCSNA